MGQGNHMADRAQSLTSSRVLRLQSQLTNPLCSSTSSSLKGKSAVALSLSTPAKRATAILAMSAKTTPHLCSEVNWLLVPHKAILCRTRNTVPTRCVCFFKDESARINILQSGDQALGDGICTSERIFIHMLEALSLCLGGQAHSRRRQITNLTQVFEAHLWTTWLSL